MEIWKPIEELPGYSVSNKGRVRKDSNGQIMVLSKNNGYCRITISKHIHRLVAKAFLDAPENSEQSLHFFFCAAIAQFAKLLICIFIVRL